MSSYSNVKINYNTDLCNDSNQILSLTGHIPTGTFVLSNILTQLNTQIATLLGVLTPTSIVSLGKLKEAITLANSPHLNARLLMGLPNYPIPLFKDYLNLLQSLSVELIASEIASAIGWLNNLIPAVINISPINYFFATVGIPVLNIGINLSTVITQIANAKPFLSQANYIIYLNAQLSQLTGMLNAANAIPLILVNIVDPYSIITVGTLDSIDNFINGSNLSCNCVCKSDTTNNGNGDSSDLIPILEDIVTKTTTTIIEMGTIVDDMLPQFDPIMSTIQGGAVNGKSKKVKTRVSFDSV